MITVVMDGRRRSISHGAGRSLGARAPQNAPDWSCPSPAAPASARPAAPRIIDGARGDDAQYCAGAVGNRRGIRAVLPGPAHDGDARNQLRRKIVRREPKGRKMSYDTIIFEVERGIARLTLNRPDKLNSFNSQMHGEVRQALASIGRERCASAGTHRRGPRILRRPGPGRSRRGSRRPSASISDGQSRKTTIPWCCSLQELPMPVIAAVNGVAAGAGANIALACDLVIAARSANFVQAFSKLGLIPDCGGTWTLPRLVGNARALGLTLLGNKLSAEQAAAWGMIWQMRRGCGTRSDRRCACAAIRGGAHSRARRHQGRNSRRLAALACRAIGR